MALVSCSECNKQISDRAASCPHCGYGLGKRSEQATGFDAVTILGSFVVSVVLMGLVAATVSDRNEPLKIGLLVVCLASPPIAALVWSNRRKS